LLLRILLPQYAQRPVQVNNSRWISRRVCGRVHPEVFFNAQHLQGQEGVRQHHLRHMMIPARPIAAFVVIQPQLLLELLIVPFDLPPTFGDAHQSPQRVVWWQVAEKVFRGLPLAARPFHQQPDLLMGWLAFVETVRGSDAAGVEARLQPAFRTFSPADLLPSPGLLRHLSNRGGRVSP